MYKVFVSSTADRQLRRISPQQRKRILNAIQKLASDPRPKGKLIKKLVGKEGWRFRVGNLRILYTIDDLTKIILVYEIGKRGDIY